MSKQLTTSKTHWKDFFNYKYLGSQDLEVGKDLIVTVKRTAQEKHKVTGGKEESFLVVHFEGQEKGMIFNKTNSRSMMLLAKSAYVEDWIGKTIALYITTTSFGGKTVEALRIREKAVEVKKPKPFDVGHEHWGYAIKQVAEDKVTIDKIKETFPMSKEVEEKLSKAADALKNKMAK